MIQGWSKHPSSGFVIDLTSASCWLSWMSLWSQALEVLFKFALVLPRRHTCCSELSTLYSKYVTAAKCIGWSCDCALSSLHSAYARYFPRNPHRTAHFRAISSDAYICAERFPDACSSSPPWISMTTWKMHSPKLLALSSVTLRIQSH